MAENLAYSTRLGVLTEDKRLLEAALQSVTGAADFAYVWVYGEQQRPLIQFFGKLFDAKHVIADFPNNKRTRIYDHGEILLDNFVLGNQRYVEYIAPVISDYSNTPYELQIERRDPHVSAAEPKRQQRIGAVRIGLSLSRVDAHMASFLTWRGWSVAVFLCLSTVAIYIFADRITRPINRLTEQAKKMSQGDLNQTIPVDTQDEIGQLATAFNDMGRSLCRQCEPRTSYAAQLDYRLRAVAQEGDGRADIPAAAGEY
jgi:methyl-accepting chemotaxis protein